MIGLSQQTWKGEELVGEMVKKLSMTLRGKMMEPDDLNQRSAGFFCKESESKPFRLWEPRGKKMRKLFTYI